MRLLKSLIDLTERRVKKFGAQYYTFAIFGIINYPLAYIYEAAFKNNSDGLYLRFISAFLCILLLLKDKWPFGARKYIPLLWYSTILISLPLLTTFLLIKDNFSLDYLINFNIGVMIVILLLDSISFLVVSLLGISLGILCASIAGIPITTDRLLNNENLSLFFYMFSCIVVLGSIFTRNKEVYNDYIQKARDNLNEFLEKRVKERTLELEEALAAKTEFLNNMSHEIRTPIQGFTTLSEGLVEHWNSLNEERKINLAVQVAGNAKRLASLVNNLLDLSKFNANKMIMDFHQMDFKASIIDILEECKELYLSKKKVQINFNAQENENITIIGDENRILQVLRNLFANAIKFLPDEGGKIQVSLKKTLFKDKDAWHFSVKDNGVGIPQHEIEEIFEPFIQSSITKTKAGGTGLGLSICKQIINAHHGKIWAENNLDGSGASFNFIIPVEQVADTVAIISVPSTSVSLGEKANILMIDDEEVCLVSMELLVVNTNFSLIKAGSGAAGLEYLKAHYDEIDIVLLDLMMPDIYGLVILEEMKRNPLLCKIPVILQSGTSDKSEIDKAYAMGISSFISKPYQKDVVISSIKEAITKK